jgi:hypothetical protein
MHPIGGDEMATHFFGNHMIFRRFNFQRSIFLSLALSILVAAPAVFAQDSQPRALKKSQGKGSDPRLPPVLPGETIETEGGEKMNVWSSSGPVVVAPPDVPQVPALGATQPYGGAAVIVDGRGFPLQRPDIGR